ncbi:MAG TPA: HAD-IA family hydrolase [Parachlamydiaceae bacterium]|nr:HAD-IA family hydrolase [Parachlamydiaceae bacterium]
MQKTSIFIFDLDDTLYDELSYVYSGFLAVAKFLEKATKLPSKEIFQELKEILKSQDRGHVFDLFLKRHHLFSKKLVKECLNTYRNHIPKITLYEDAKKLLQHLKGHPIYIVTDGHKLVQENKIKALKLDKMVKHYYLTNRYGLKNNKPSPYCFLKICKQEKITPEEVVYIGDNPHKDFLGLKPLGFKTVRLLRGRYQHIQLEKWYEAEKTIRNLNELIC